MIIIPSKSDKLQSTLIDALRIMAWTMHKSTNKLNGPAAYQAYDEFESEWKQHEIHSYDLNKVQEFISELGYTEQELLDQRSRYYELKAQLNRNSAA